MIPHQVAFAITTLYPRWYNGHLQSVRHTDKIRGDLAITFFERATREGYRVVVVDGKSTKTFHKALKNIPGIHVLKRHGFKRSPARRQAYKNAASLKDIRVVIATEPEKISLLDSVASIVEPILTGKADIIIPKRDEALFQSSYPHYQYESETEGNRLYNELLKSEGYLPHQSEDLDVFFGPRVFRNDRQIRSLFMRKYAFRTGNLLLRNEILDPEELSNALFFPIVNALKRGLKIRSVTIPFEYPSLQKENELIGNREYFEEKRKSQRLGLLVELMHFLHHHSSHYGQRITR